MIPVDLIYKLAKTKFGIILCLIGQFGLGAGLLIYGLLLNVHLDKPGVDLNIADRSTLQITQHVEFDLEFLFGDYMYTTRRDEVASRSYVIPVLRTDEEGRRYTSYYLALEAKTAREYDIYDRISDNSYAWATDETGTVEWAPEKEHLNGYLRLMNFNERRYMKSYLSGMGYSEAEIHKLMVPYVVVTDTELVGLRSVLGVFLLAGGVINLIFMIRQSVKNRKNEV